MPFEKLSELEEQIGKAIVNAAYKLHTELGPGLLEKVYETCLLHELRKAGFQVARQVQIPIKYDGIEFDDSFRVDIIVEGKVVIEVKAMDQVFPVWVAQVLSYLRLTDRRLGFLINFHVVSMKEGIRRIIL